MVEICWKYEATITQSHAIVIVPKIAQPYCLYTYVYHHNNYEHTHNDRVSNIKNAMNIIFQYLGTLCLI